MTKVNALVQGGSATAGPPLGPALAPLGVNVGQVVAKINEATKDYSGIEVPVTVIVNPDKTFNIEVGSPAVAALIKKELGVEKGAGNREAPCGDLSLDAVIKIAKMKKDQLLTRDEKAMINQVIGTCVSVGCTVNGKNPREVQKEILEGKIQVSL